MSHPEYIQKAIEEAAEPGSIAFTHKLTQIPMDELSELPLGLVTGASEGRRSGDFEIIPPTQDALRMMRTAMSSLPKARKRPGLRMAAMASCMVNGIGGEAMPLKIADRAARFGNLTIGDAYTLIFMLQSKRQGGSVDMLELDCPHCGEGFAPRLRLSDRPVNVYRQQIGEEPDPENEGKTRPVWGGLLPPDQTPHAVVHLREPVTLGGRTCRKLVQRTPSWSSAMFDLPRVVWANDEDDSTALYESIVQAGVIGDESGPFTPINRGAWRRSGLMSYDFDELRTAAIALAGGPPPLITVSCPFKGDPENGVMGCEGRLAIPVGWDAADDFFSLT